MGEITIHNGEVFEDGVPISSPPASPIAPPPEKRKAEEELQPEEIARRMAACISQGIDAKMLPMQIVNELLVLRTEGGQKLVWTKHDVRQAFVLWSKKLEGSLKA